MTANGLRMSERPSCWFDSRRGSLRKVDLLIPCWESRGACLPSAISFTSTLTMKKDVDKAKKMLAAKTPKVHLPEVGLSSGSTLFNLAATGKLHTAYYPGKFYHYVGDPASGKAQPLDCKVLTPHGWRMMGQMEVGDRIIDPDGGQARVSAIHPQGVKAVYLVEMADGATTKCCAEHLWYVENKNDKKRGTHRVLNTLEIARGLEKEERYYTPALSPVVFDVSAQELPIPPYLLGALIGNAYFGKTTVSISSADAEIVDRVGGLLPDKHKLSYGGRTTYRIVYKKKKPNIVQTHLKSLGLSGCRAQHKFIPKEYLTASVQERIELLQGLMDTDGYVSGNGELSYSTASKRLADDVTELVHSLGGRATLCIKPRPQYTHKGEKRIGQPSHNLFIRMPDERDAVYLTRKRDRIKNERIGKSRKIVRVTEIGQEYCQCITVTSKRSLYVTDGYIVTHNSSLTMTCFAEASINPKFNDYQLIYDNSEDGMDMDIEKFFGKRCKDRLRPPAGTVASPKFSTTVEEFYYHIDDVTKKGPCIYVLDSMDGITSNDEEDKFQEQKAAYNKGKTTTGSYGTSKPKANSARLRVARNKLQETGSILIIVSQSRDNIGFGSQFNPKTHGGGWALTFFSSLKIWYSVRQQIKKTVNGKERDLGIISKLNIVRNRHTGRKGSVEVPIYWSSGLDDIGSCVDFLVDEKHWSQEKEKGVIAARGLDLSYRREELIQRIQTDGLENDVKAIVADVWAEIERGCSVQRKNRYGE